MQLKTADIKKLLKDYNLIKIEVENSVANKADTEKLRFIDNCLKTLNEQNRQIIVKIYIDKMNITTVAKQLYINRTTLYRRINKIITLLETAYRKKFKKN